MTRTLAKNTRCLSFFLLVGLSLFVSGCSSVITHSMARASSPPPPMYMGGMRMDYLAVAESESWGPQAYGVVDMPFSLIADVILLPYDLYADIRHTENPELDGTNTSVTLNP